MKYPADITLAKWPKWTSIKWKCSHSVSVRLFVTLWTVAHQTPLSMEFSRQEHWSGLPFPSPGDLPNPGIGTRVSHIAGRLFTNWTTREDLNIHSNGTNLHPLADLMIRTLYFIFLMFMTKMHNLNLIVKKVTPNWGIVYKTDLHSSRMSDYKRRKIKTEEANCSSLRQ